jgi:basic amino acid/polyamine antiporter, APA family
LAAVPGAEEVHAFMNNSAGNQASHEQASGLLHTLNGRDATAIVAGTVIGSGIFLVPHDVALQLNSFGAVMLVWIVGGALSLFGALALSELGAMYPGAGGLYVYLRHAYGKCVGFLYGWALLTLIHSGSLATLAVAFRLYLARLVPMSPMEQKASGIACVLGLAILNCFGLRWGRGVQNFFAAAKLGGLALMVGILFALGHSHFSRASFSAETNGGWHAAGFGIALVAVLWAYEGWHVVSFTAGEFKNVQRDLPRGLMLGTLIVALVYLVSNAAYYFVLAPAQIRQTEQVAWAALGSVMQGPAIFISSLILICIFGAMNGLILTGPRVYYAMADEGLFFQAFKKISPRFRTPVISILVQGIWGSLLTLLGSFQELFTYVIFTAWIFYGLAVAALIVLRIRQPQVHRPFRAPGYPWLPAIFSAAALGVTLSAIVANPRHAAYGAGLVLTGVPLYALFVLRNKRSRPAPSDAARSVISVS